MSRKFSYQLLKERYDRQDRILRETSRGFIAVSAGCTVFAWTLLMFWSVVMTKTPTVTIQVAISGVCSLAGSYFAFHTIVKPSISSLLRKVADFEDPIPFSTDEDE